VLTSIKSEDETAGTPLQKKKKRGGTTIERSPRRPTMPPKQKELCVDEVSAFAQGPEYHNGDTVETIEQYPRPETDELISWWHGSSQAERQGRRDERIQAPNEVTPTIYSGLVAKTLTQRTLSTIPGL
jgi:hypothetical protein